MSSELVQFIDAPIQIAFDWDATVAEIKSLIEEDKALGKQQDEIIERRYAIRVQIGFNLIALQHAHAKKGYGDFIAFAENEFGYKRSAIYERVNVAKRLGNLNVRGRAHSNWETARELARPTTSDIVIEQVLDGRIEANPDAIKQARKEEAEAKQRANELETENKQLQSQFDFYKQGIELKEEAQKEIIKKEIDQLRQKIETLEKEPISPAIRARIEELETELKERTRQRDNLAKLREQLSNELDEQRDANKARREQEMYEHRINDRVKKITEEWGKCSVSLLGQLPSPIESQVVNDGNWALIDHVTDMAQRIIDSISQLKTSKTSLFLESEASNAN